MGGGCCNASNEEALANIEIQKSASQTMAMNDAPPVEQEVENHKIDETTTYTGTMKTHITQEGIKTLLREGIGKVYFNGGGHYSGTWKGDKLNGHGTFTYPNGDKYEGNFVDDKACGMGKITHANG